MQRILNHKKDSSRQGDLLFKCFSPIHLMALEPSQMDLRPWDVGIFDQGNIGSCTAHAGAGIWGFVEKVELTKKLVGRPEEFGALYKDCSRLMLYYAAREFAGDTDQDGGAELRDIMQAFNKIGCCIEDAWPYDTTKVLVKPSPEAYGQAYHHRIAARFRITDGSLEEMKTCLLQGFPFVFGFSVFDSFMSEEVAKTGVMPMPDLMLEKLQGGHAVEAVGFDDAKEHFIIRNSWGSGWGDKGYFYMPYAFISNDQLLASDFWTIRV